MHEDMEMRRATILEPQMVGTINSPLPFVHESFQSFLKSLPRPCPSKLVSIQICLLIMCLIPKIVSLHQSWQFNWIKMSVGPSTLYSFGKLVKKSNYNVLSQDKKDIPKGAVGGLGVLQNLVAKWKSKGSKSNLSKAQQREIIHIAYGKQLSFQGVLREAQTPT